MTTMASQITSLTVVYSIVYSGADQRKHQNSASLAFVWGIHRWPVNSPHKGPVTRKMFPFDDVIMRNVPSNAARLLASAVIATKLDISLSNFMMASSNETFSALLALCTENSWSPVNSPYKSQWRGLLMVLIWARTNGWAKNLDAGDLRHHGAHNDVLFPMICNTFARKRRHFFQNGRQGRHFFLLKTAKSSQFGSD